MVFKQFRVPCPLDASWFRGWIVTASSTDDVVLEGAVENTPTTRLIFEAGNTGSIGVGEGQVGWRAVAAKANDGVPDGGLCERLAPVEGVVPVSMIVLMREIVGLWREGAYG